MKVLVVLALIATLGTTAATFLDNLPFNSKGDVQAMREEFTEGPYSDYEYYDYDEELQVSWVKWSTIVAATSGGIGCAVMGLRRFKTGGKMSLPGVKRGRAIFGRILSKVPRRKANLKAAAVSKRKASIPVAAATVVEKASVDIEEPEIQAPEEEVLEEKEEEVEPAIEVEEDSTEVEAEETEETTTDSAVETDEAQEETVETEEAQEETEAAPDAATEEEDVGEETA